jgi:hypothetical protein
MAFCEKRGGSQAGPQRDSGDAHRDSAHLSMTNPPPMLYTKCSLTFSPTPVDPPDNDMVQLEMYFLFVRHLRLSERAIPRALSGDDLCRSPWRERTKRTKILSFAGSTSRSAGLSSSLATTTLRASSHFSSTAGAAEVHLGTDSRPAPEALNLPGPTESATLGRQGAVFILYRITI